MYGRVFETAKQIVKKVSQIISSHYLCPMLYEKKTAAQAVLHFAENEYKIILPHLYRDGAREYDRVRKIIHDAKRGRVSDRRAKALLEKYGGEGYRVTSVFEVAVTEPNGPAFAQALEKIWAENEGELDETKL